MNRRKKLGVISPEKQIKVRRSAHRSCDEAFKSHAEEKACRFGVDSTLQSLHEEKELGTFQSCADRCPEGFERVVLKRDEDKLPTVCVCRLDPSTRKKFRGDKYKVAEEKRKPFGKWKSPVHLRRCVEFDEKGRCRKKGLPGVELKKIRR